MEQFDGQPFNAGLGKSEIMIYRAVIFDLDGTLLDTLSDLAASMNQVLHCLGFPEHLPDAYKYFVGEGMVNLARRALPPEQRRADVIDQAAAALREEYGRRWRCQTKPYPGIPELLGTLSLLEIKLGVLTNKPDNLAKVLVAAYFPDIHFTAVAGAKPSLPLKPDPAGARALAQQLALPPAAIIFVGDSGTDMLTAAAAGMFGAGALWGFRPAEELSAAGAHTLLKTPADLLMLLQR
jgi:phosphoglycolate phosphatase